MKYTISNEFFPPPGLPLDELTPGDTSYPINRQEIMHLMQEISKDMKDLNQQLLVLVQKGKTQIAF